MESINKIFTNEQIKILESICDNPDIPILARRQDMVIEEMSKFGFVEEGAGTNRIILSHEDYPDVVFKIAIDKRGKLDNDTEKRLTDMVNKDVKEKITITYESNSIIAIAEKVNVMTASDMEENIKVVMKILDFLRKGFVLNDVSPKTHENWGISNNGDIKICDYAYLTPLEEITHTVCKRCGGNLEYSEDLTHMICTKCGSLHTYSDITGGMYNPLLERGFESEATPDLNENNLLEPDENEIRENHTMLHKLGFM